MKLLTSTQSVLKRFADFHGRSTRPEYWWFALANAIALAILNRIAVVPGADSSVLGVLWNTVFAVPALAVTVRRLHDTGRSAHNLWWLLLPFIGWIILLVYLAQGTRPEANKYDEPATRKPNYILMTLFTLATLGLGLQGALDAPTQVPNTKVTTADQLETWYHENKTADTTLTTDGTSWDGDQGEGIFSLYVDTNKNGIADHTEKVTAKATFRGDGLYLNYLTDKFVDYLLDTPAHQKAVKEFTDIVTTAKAAGSTVTVNYPTNLLFGPTISVEANGQLQSSNTTSLPEKEAKAILEQAGATYTITHE